MKIGKRETGTHRRFALGYPLLLFSLCVCMGCSDDDPAGPGQVSPVTQVPHISYFDVTNADLKYAVKSGAAWILETVDATGSVGEYTSLVLDAQGNPHISYHDATNEDLKYAVKSGTSWAHETVDATGQVGGFTSLVL
ncbi:MAG: hypothetical protein KAJ17_00525, partial [Candidatus Krumholzibacteria bacterium]|nr:hypothetical protein [Candidatus Krumholzibacteria bacterium]